jgi:hypothetical protein
MLILAGKHKGELATLRCICAGWYSVGLAGGVATLYRPSSVALDPAEQAWIDNLDQTEPGPHYYPGGKDRS